MGDMAANDMAANDMAATRRGNPGFCKSGRKEEAFVEIPIDEEDFPARESEPDTDRTMLPLSAEVERVVHLESSLQQTKPHRAGTTGGPIRDLTGGSTRDMVGGSARDVIGGSTRDVIGGPSGDLQPTTAWNAPQSTSTTTTAAEDANSSRKPSATSFQTLFKKIWSWNNEETKQSAQDSLGGQRRRRNSRSYIHTRSRVESVPESEIIDTESDDSNEIFSNSNESDCFSLPSSNHSLLSSSSSLKAEPRTHRDLEPDQSTLSIACRICQLNEEETDEELERTPCHCKGSLQFAHKSCVDKWIRTQRSTSCEICKGQLVETESATQTQRQNESNTLLDRLTNRLLINLGVTDNQLTREEINEIRLHVGRQLQRTALNGIVCALTVSIVVTCYMIVVTSHIEIGLPLLCVLVIITIACREKLAQLENN